MRYQILKMNKLALRILRLTMSMLFLICCMAIYAEYCQASGFNVTNPVAPPVVGQAPTTSSGVRANWLGYFAPPAWMQRRGSGSDRREQQRGVISPGIGQ